MDSQKQEIVDREFLETFCYAADKISRPEPQRWRPLGDDVYDVSENFMAGFQTEPSPP
jgi:hypothetical protein